MMLGWEGKIGAYNRTIERKIKHNNWLFQVVIWKIKNKHRNHQERSPNYWEILTKTL
jgi:hypothetical protein